MLRTHGMENTDQVVNEGYLHIHPPHTTIYNYE